MNERELTDSEVKRFLSDVEAICIEENISLQNCKVWRHTSGRVAPVRGFPGVTTGLSAGNPQAPENL